MTITPVVQPTTSTKNARIGYENLLTATTTSAAAKMLTPNTYERYRPAAGNHTVKFQLATSSSVNFVGFAAHNAASTESGIDIRVYYATSIGGALTLLETAIFTKDDAKLITFDAKTIAEIIITFTTAAPGLEIGVIYAGKYLEMQRPIYGGHSPIDLSAKTEYESTLSESGNFLGRTIKNQGTESAFNWKHLDPTWYRDSFQLFVESAKTTPFFIQWRPDLYETSTFGFTTSDIKPDNMGGGHKLMSVGFNIRGHSN